MTAHRRTRLAAQRVYLIASPPAPTPVGSIECAAWLERVAAVCRAGVGLLQLRAKRSSTDERRAWLGELRARLPEQALVIVNDDLAAAHDTHGHVLADGVHLGRGDARSFGRSTVEAGLAAARRQLPPELLLGTSTRNWAELEAALRAGADHAGFGAMATSPTKADTELAEPAELARCAQRLPGFPIFPIGGLGLHNLALLEATGVGRLAVSSAILDAHDPCAAARALLAWCALRHDP